MPLRSTILLRRRAQALALQTRRQLGIPAASPVDVYSAIRDLRLWLLFEPLSGSFGMYQRQGDASGIVINVKVHPALQRYTAAHELGHHVMGHQASFDPETNIKSWTSLNQQELGAQMFAAEFLMPLPAINESAALLGIDKEHLDAMSAYQLSLRLRTSYSAMVTRLETLGWVTGGGAENLRRVTPKQLKQELLGRSLDDPQSDVWLVTDRHSASSISPQIGDEVVVSLLENPTTGYRWAPSITDGLHLTEDEFDPRSPQSDERIGASGIRRWGVRVAADGPSQARFVLRRPWEQEGEVARSFDVLITSNARPEPGVDPYQQPALLAV